MAEGTAASNTDFIEEEAAKEMTENTEYLYVGREDDDDQVGGSTAVFCVHHHELWPSMGWSGKHIPFKSPFLPFYQDPDVIAGVAPELQKTAMFRIDKAKVSDTP